MAALHLQWSALWNRFKEVYLPLKFDVCSPSKTGDILKIVILIRAVCCYFRQVLDDGFFNDTRMDEGQVKDDDHIANFG